MKRVVLSPAEHAPCLIGYDVTFFERIEAQIEAQFADDFGPGQSIKARNSFAMTEELPYDENGRIILSAIMRANGDIGDHAIFLGAGNYFELWSPQLLLEEPGQDPRLVRTVKAMLAQKGLA